MFEHVPMSPPDPIFGLAEEFRSDPRTDKVNLTVGVYKDENDQIPVMAAVRTAHEALLQDNRPHGYLPIDGDSLYNDVVNRLILGDDHVAVKEQRTRTMQTPGGTGALRIAGDLLRHVCDVRRIWISQPTWGNHLQIFNRVGLEITPYDYLDERQVDLDFERIMQQMEGVSRGDAVLLHAVCHNPSGVDPSPEQWTEWLGIISDRGAIPLFDFAYQGFGSEIDTDATPIREFCRGGRFHGEALICNSFSKSFNLYGQRVGGLTVTTADSDAANRALSQMKSLARTMYSNPPRFGAELVQRVLTDDALRHAWMEELGQIRTRIAQLRQQFVDGISARVPEADFTHILRQRGMFSFSGLRGDQAERLKRDFGIYLLKNGRINVAGLNSSNIDYVCDSIAQLLKSAVESTARH